MIDRLRLAVGRVGFAVSAVRQMGVFSGFGARGLTRFASRLTGLRFKPHLALMLHASMRPDDLALVDESVRLTFRQLDKRINRLANVLREAGVDGKAAVALMMRNSADTVIAQEALPRLGAVAVQIGYRSTIPEVAHIIDNSRPSAFIIDGDFVDVVLGGLEVVGHTPKIILTRGGQRSPETRELEDSVKDASDKDPPAGSGGGSVIVYTSGTTGKPKGAHRDLAQTGVGAVIDMLHQIGAKRGERHLVVCPLYHSAAPAFVKMTYALGGAVVVLPRFDVEEVLAAIERERITSAFMVPTQLSRLADCSDAQLAAHDTSSLRWVMSGAAPLPTETARRFQDSFGPILYNFYGATETGTVSLAGPADHLTRPGTVGRLLRENEARIVGKDGSEAALGDVGELWIRNPMIIGGYHRNDAATRKSLRDGYFSVGDLARLDVDGFLYIESRVDDMVISGGVNIYPREIEDVLHSHPDVEEAAVLGLPDAEWGEVVAAFVVRRTPGALDEQAVIATCRASLSSVKAPRRVFFVDKLPRNPTGKVLKRLLREGV